MFYWRRVRVTVYSDWLQAQSASRCSTQIGQGGVSVGSLGGTVPAQALLPLLAALPGALPRSPDLLLLDGLEHYVAACPCSRGAARLAALLVDTAVACATCPHAPGLGCQLIASVCSPGTPDAAQRLAALVRYFPARCRLSPAPGEEGPGQAWMAHLCQAGAPSHTWTILFSPHGELSMAPAPGEEALGLGGSWGEGREHNRQPAGEV
ncbi:ATPase SWSAP1 [Alligator sinensis]|uniref:ATPase SWSAP1 n=1 Tax=Alligator sinensis TaxID=38654 RepID=A0A3Q0GN71_ALLSI|nr:ATPase SWSAP1 [Alligator sinensis]